MPSLNTGARTLGRVYDAETPDLIGDYRRRRNGKIVRREKAVRRLPGTICGRRHCGQCGHWRQANDYTVNKWVDAEKTIPRSFKKQCQACLRIRKQQRKSLRRKQRGRHLSARELEQRRVNEIIALMTREELYEYELEGGLPLTVAGYTCEDSDPTPVKPGCPQCWRNGSVVCGNCPDPETKTKRTAYLKANGIHGMEDYYDKLRKGLILPG